MNSGASRHKSRRYVQGARAEAAEATGRRIVETFLVRLMTGWFDEITLERIAADAGVTVQTVIRRFASKEGLLAEAVKTLASQITARRAAPSGDLRRRVQNLVEDYEHTGDAIIRLLALEPRQPVLHEFLELGRRHHRDWAAALLVERGGTRDGARAVDALVVVTDVYTWKLLRRDMGRGVGATCGAIERLVRAALDEFSDSHSAGAET